MESVELHLSREQWSACRVCCCYKQWFFVESCAKVFNAFRKHVEHYNRIMPWYLQLCAWTLFSAPFLHVPAIVSGNNSIIHDLSASLHVPAAFYPTLRCSPMLLCFYFSLEMWHKNKHRHISCEKQFWRVWVWKSACTTQFSVPILLVKASKAPNAFWKIGFGTVKLQHSIPFFSAAFTCHSSIHTTSERMSEKLLNVEGLMSRAETELWFHFCKVYS